MTMHKACRFRWGGVLFGASLFLGMGFGLALPASPLSAQDDVLELGRIYGTRPPEAYMKFKREHPDAFEFSRALWRRNPRLDVKGAGLEALQVWPSVRAPEVGAAAARVIGPRGRAVEGDIAFPLVLGYYADDEGPPPFSVSQVQQEFFDGPNSRHQTVPEFYSEMSRGRVTLLGETLDWVQSDLTHLETTAEVSGLGGSRVGDFIHSLLARVDNGSVNWGRFDNDGPDGIPNSGDDDGYVDVLAVFHPTWGAECPSPGRPNRVWSHRWSLSAAGFSAGSENREYVTRSTSANGDMIRIDDYTIQPVYACDEQSINEIGVFAHELGHGFGLPDLYCTSAGCRSAGAGSWDLMAFGSWGCGDRDPSQPCHMGAWSKLMLGWVDVEPVPPGEVTSVTLPSVQSSGRVVRIDAQDGSGDYLLLENRQIEGSDVGMFSSGLLVWHINDEVVQTRWSTNGVNATPTAQGVRLQQADGLDDLNAYRNRADPGDPFPGSSGNPTFHAGTRPAARRQAGQALGITITDITETNGVVTFDALARFQTLTLRVEGAERDGLVRLNDEPLNPRDTVKLSLAPFESVVVSAEAGDSLGPGLRRPFVGWGDEGSNARIRTVIVGTENVELVARYAGEQARVTADVTGSVLGVPPGTVNVSPRRAEPWFDLGQTVTFSAVPRSGFAFTSWSGGASGSENPVQRVISAPLTVSAGFSIGFEGLVQPFLGGPEVDDQLMEALDVAANGNGVYDIGDVRSWLRSVQAGNPSARVLRAMGQTGSGGGQ